MFRCLPFALLITLSNCIITFQTGFVSNFYLWATDNILFASLDPNRYFSTTINFSQSFSNIPEVFIMMEVYDLDSGSQQGFQFYLYSITKTSFTVKIQLPYANRYNGVEFRYYAFDDKRRQVISKFNQPNPQSGTLSISHSNPNFVVGITSVISLEYQGSFSYSVDKTLVTSTNCQITMSLSNTITQIGYQILLGTKDAFYIKGTIKATYLPSYVGDFNFESGWANSQLLAVYQGISYQEGITFRIRFKKNSVPTKTGYSVESWVNSQVQFVYHSYGAIRGQWDEGYYESFTVSKVFLSKNLDKNIGNMMNSFDFNIPELNFQTQSQGIFYFDVDSSFSDFRLIFQRKCEISKKITVQILQKNNCFYQYETLCTSKRNICNQIFYFQTSTPIISNLKIIIVSDTSFIIQHEYIDQTEKQIDVITIKYIP